MTTEPGTFTKSSRECVFEADFSTMHGDEANDEILADSIKIEIKNKSKN